MRRPSVPATIRMENAKVGKELLPQTVRRIDDLIAQAQADGRTPSLAAAVTRDGELAHFAAAGVDGATGEQPTADTQFRIGSITKTMTAALIMQLRDERKLGLDDLLCRHLPDTPVDSAITLRQLLGHVSGLQREPDGEWWERVEGQELDTLLSELTTEKIAYPPHQTYHYSNLAYGLLGAVLHRVTGMSWPDLVHKRLLEPLSMRRTSYAPIEPFARGFVVHPWYDTLREEPRVDTRAMAPAGQLWSTPADLIKWAAFLAEPHPAVLAPQTVTEMCAPVVLSDVDSWTAGHGLGLELYRRGERIYAGHGGSMPGYLAHLLTHRPSRTGVVVFASSYTMRGVPISKLSQDLLTCVLDAEPAAPAPWRPAAGSYDTGLHELAGSWWWMGRELVAGWDARAGELVLTPGGTATPWRCKPHGSDVWRCYTGANDGELVRVKRDEHGVPQELDIATFLHSRLP
jgi:CubicO group peptidase (beta-lactamase class C family)